MTELPEPNVVNGIIPDVSWIKGFGTVFEWTPELHRLVNRQFDAAVRAKRISPIGVGHKVFLIAFILTVFLSGMMSIIIVPTILRQPYGTDSSNLFAGAVLGVAGVGIVSILYGWILSRSNKVDDNDWVYTTVRVGVENDVLWIFKHNTFYLYPDKSSFVKVTKVEDFVIANIAKRTAHFFPSKTLSQTEAGEKVLAWFGASLPIESISELNPEPVPKLVWIRRFIKRVSMFLLVYGIACLLIFGVIYVSNQWQELKNQETFAKRRASEKNTTSAPPSGNALENFARPDSK